MKTIISLFVLSMVLILFKYQEPDDFDRALSRIAEDFKKVIMDEDACEEVKDKAEDIANEIEELLEEPEAFSAEEISQLRQLKTEAEGIEDFIALVADVGSALPKFEDFNKANERIRTNLYYISKDEHCIDILVVEIDEYRAYIASNNSNKSFTLNFEWKTKDKSSFGKSKKGILTKTIRHMLDNRDGHAMNNLDFLNISCQEF